MLRAIVHIDRRLRRVWIMGQRVHHGAVGAAMIACGTLLCLHDKRDLPDWFRRDRWT